MSNLVELARDVFTSHFPETVSPPALRWKLIPFAAMRKVSAIRTAGVGRHATKHPDHWIDIYTLEGLFLKDSGNDSCQYAMGAILSDLHATGERKGQPIIGSSENFILSFGRNTRSLSQATAGNWASEILKHKLFDPIAGDGVTKIILDQIPEVVKETPDHATVKKTEARKVDSKLQAQFAKAKAQFAEELAQAAQPKGKK